MTKVQDSGAPRAPDAIEALLTAAKNLSSEDRAKLIQAGFVVPNTGSTSLDAPAKFGYRCSKCGNIALEFIGTKFTDGDGKETDELPAGLPIGQLPWRQPELRAERVNRGAPICQCCGQTVFFNRGGYLIAKYVVLIEPWRASRDKAFEVLRKNRAKLRSGVAPDQDASQAVDVAAYGANASYDADQDRLMADAKARNEAANPGLQAAVEEAAFKGNLLDNMTKGTLSVPKTDGRMRVVPPGNRRAEPS